MSKDIIPWMLTFIPPRHTTDVSGFWSETTVRRPQEPFLMNSGKRRKLGYVNPFYEPHRRDEGDLPNIMTRRKVLDRENDEVYRGVPLVDAETGKVTMPTETNKTAKLFIQKEPTNADYQTYRMVQSQNGPTPNPNMMPERVMKHVFDAINVRDSVVWDDSDNDQLITYNSLVNGGRTFATIVTEYDKRVDTVFVCGSSDIRTREMTQKALTIGLDTLRFVIFATKQNYTSFPAYVLILQDEPVSAPNPDDAAPGEVTDRVSGAAPAFVDRVPGAAPAGDRVPPTPVAIEDYAPPPETPIPMPMATLSAADETPNVPSPSDKSAIAETATESASPVRSIASTIGDAVRRGIDAMASPFKTPPIDPLPDVPADKNGTLKGTLTMIVTDASQAAKHTGGVHTYEGAKLVNAVFGKLEKGLPKRKPGTWDEDNWARLKREYREWIANNKPMGEGFSGGSFEGQKATEFGDVIKNTNMEKVYTDPVTKINVYIAELRLNQSRSVIRAIREKSEKVGPGVDRYQGVPDDEGFTSSKQYEDNGKYAYPALEVLEDYYSTGTAKNIWPGNQLAVAVYNILRSFGTKAKAEKSPVIVVKLKEIRDYLFDRAIDREERYDKMVDMEKTQAKAQRKALSELKQARLRQIGDIYSWSQNRMRTISAESYPEEMRPFVEMAKRWAEDHVANPWDFRLQRATEKIYK